MDRPGAALLGSLVVHAAVVAAVALALISGAGRLPPPPMVNSVPVSIVSEMTIAAGPADAPSDEPVASDSATAPPPTAPEPPPPAPNPVPSPRPPAKPPAPRPDAPTKRPPPPSAPAPTKRGDRTPPEDTLCLTCLAGERSPNQRPPRTRETRPPAGERGTGNAGRATGPQLQNIAGQVQSRWDFQCDLPGARELVVPVRMTIGENGRVTAGPTFLGGGNGAAWRSATDTMRRAIAAAQPFRLPDDWEAQQITLRFRADLVCANQ